MKIAVITGASSGLGKEYALAVSRLRQDIDEIWLIARRKEKLEETASNLSRRVRILPFDITDSKNIEEYTQLLQNENAEVMLLINNAGFGKLGNFTEIDTAQNAGMIRLNCEALTVMTSVTLPYMNQKSEIINTCSIASFAPNTRMAVYSSTKAYVLSFSRALRSELKQRKINVLAVCPGPMSTEFLSVAGIEDGSSKAFDKLPRDNAQKIAEHSLKASQKGKSVFCDHIFYKLYKVLAKILPTSLVMKMAKT